MGKERSLDNYLQVLHPITKDLASDVMPHKHINTLSEEIYYVYRVVKKEFQTGVKILF